ncbi:MAG: flavodoxin domain-containing protein [Deltaproteobacteria bacterium]|nr:flavodoxin domain-containing protein [Deltaproteobacteria bacterium]
MPRPVLVTYTTKYGSTAQVASAVATVLGDQGLEVDLHPAREVRSLEQYRAVVLGAPIFIGSLQREARRFLDRQREALSSRPVALFALGPTRKEDDWNAAREQFEKEVAKVAWLTPIAHEMFGGRYDPTTLRFPDSLLARLPASPLYGQPASDVRDWDAIRAWAVSLAGLLPPEA